MLHIFVGAINYLLAWVTSALPQQVDEVWRAEFSQCNKGFGTGVNGFMERLFRDPADVIS